MDFAFCFTLVCHIFTNDINAVKLLSDVHRYQRHIYIKTLFSYFDFRVAVEGLFSFWT